MADPLCTFLFAGLVLVTTFSIIRDISDILMERVPRAHDLQTIFSVLLEVRTQAHASCPLLLLVASCRLSCWLHHALPGQLWG